MKFAAFVVVSLVIIVLSYFLFSTIKKTSTLVVKEPAKIKTSQVDISKGEKPNIPFTLPKGYTIHIFAKNLVSPRDLQFTPEGTLLVTDPSNNDVIALPDKNGDGVADSNIPIVNNVNHAHGLAFYKNTLFIAGVTEVDSFTWDEKTFTASNEKKLFSLPQNNDHNNRTIVFDEEGNLYVSVGSTCNVCNDTPRKGGSVWISDYTGKTPIVYAVGLRNASFMQINTATNDLWATEMGRDNLGDDIPPDEIDIVKNGQNYGWPNCYGDNIPDKNFNVDADCTSATPPIYDIPAHSAPLGLTFITSSQFPQKWQNDLLVALHGSWNRSTAVGYKVIHLTVRNNKIVGSQDFLTGFNPGTKQDDSLGRPVDLTFDNKGNLYVSDDKAGVIYIIQKNN